MLPVNPNHEPSNKQLFHHVPEHWTIRRIRTIAEMRVSNVDKHTNEQEIPVRLCNYVDVYYHDHINSDLPYMYATASYAEVQRFRLKPNDVLITKDSETWNDIAVPALVTDPPNDLICGYHLAILRPTRAIEGAYLSRALQTRPVAHQLHVKAQGITRYGLSHDDILSTSVPLPPLEEQHAIVRYLDHADELINHYIATKERLIALLEEQRQAVIHQAVTRGLDLDAPTKASGTPWIGNVPQHWDVAPVKRHYAIRLGKMLQPERHTPDDIQVPYLKAINVHWFDVSIENPSTTWASKRDIQEYAITKGDLLVCEGGEGGRSAIIESVPDGYIIQKALHRVRPKPGASNKFLLYVLSVAAHWGWFDAINNKATIAHFTVPQLSSLMIPTPPTDEQARVANHLDNQTGSIRKAIEQAQHQITLMSEYRTRLIADAVTGQIDVRDATVELPD